MTMTKKEQLTLEVALMRVKEAEEREKVLFGNAPTNTFTSTRNLTYQPLLLNAHIKFVLPGNGNTIQARIRDSELEIIGENRIEISPQATNVIQIRCKE